MNTKTHPAANPKRGEVIDFIISQKYPLTVTNRDVQEQVARSVGVNYSEATITDMRKKIRSGEIQGTPPAPKLPEPELPPANTKHPQKTPEGVVEIFASIKLIREVAKQVGGIEQMKQIADMMVEAGIE